ncbi:MAG: argininosuccinate lyase [Saprospiraceae bacterium]|jgi:argininosuccinate lyase
MKLWEKDTDLDKKIEQFTIGKDLEFDMLLAPHDVRASEAHAEMLCSIGLLTKEEFSDLQQGLKLIAQKIKKGTFCIDDGMEDVHSQIEKELTKTIGEAGKKIHMGRSRNDQVAVALKLFYKEKLREIHSRITNCVDAFLDKADTTKQHLMPGYTHSQIGMVSSFGLWFASYAEALVDDANYLVSIEKLNDQNPLGSAAGYGNSFPLDREKTTQAAGFSALSVNVIYAQMTRGKTELWIGNGLASLAYTIGKFAADVCIFVSENYKFISLPENITTGSSIMPHKKNPDVFELIRAKCNQLLSVPGQIALLTNNLMTGYHRDMQILKEIIFPALENSEQILDILLYALPRIEVKENLLDDAKYDNLYTVETVNKLTAEGLPFRDAYKLVGRQVESGAFVPDKAIHHGLIGGLHNLRLDLIRGKLIK